MLDRLEPQLAAGPNYADDGAVPSRYDPTSSGTSTMQVERDQSIEEILRQLGSIQQARARRERECDLATSDPLHGSSACCSWSRLERMLLLEPACACAYGA
jgi:hypothetical protein